MPPSSKWLALHARHDFMWKCVLPGDWFCAFSSSFSVHSINSNCPADVILNSIRRAREKKMSISVAFSLMRFPFEICIIVVEYKFGKMISRGIQVEFQDGPDSRLSQFTAKWRLVAKWFASNKTLVDHVSTNWWVDSVEIPATAHDWKHRFFYWCNRANRVIYGSLSCWSPNSAARHLRHNFSARELVSRSK